jgi:C_GCAxxG_C_C family probable redox protein
MTLTRADDAAALFTAGYSCSQSVSAAFAEDFGIDRTTALRLSGSFGGGMAHTDNSCGAVTGALMVIGMKYGMTDAGNPAGKEKTYAVAQEFITEFMRRDHAIRCTDLLGFNLSDPKQLAIARKNHIFRTKCTQYVRDAAEILEKVL